MRLIVPAYAKLNLGLEVLGRRPDGLHDLRSIMVGIDLRDQLTIDIPGSLAAPDEADLATRALRELEVLAGRALPATIQTRKAIPKGAGLGGGSADAAAVLRAAAHLAAVPSEESTIAAAFRLGADVPFQLAGGAALVEGAGERLSRLRHRPLVFAVCWPGIECSTPRVFAEVSARDFSDGQELGAAAAAWSRDEDPGPLRNALRDPARRAYPELVGVEDKLTGAGWRPRLTGSGSAFFQETGGELTAGELVARAVHLGYAAWVARTVPAHGIVQR